MFPVQQIPNFITYSRLLLAGGSFWFMGELGLAETAAERYDAGFWAFWLFLIAVSTDFLDGWLARRNNWVSMVGRVADPVVDKVLMLGSLVYLASAKNLGEQVIPCLEEPAGNLIPGDGLALMPVWAVVLMLSREFLVTAIRGLMETQGKAFGADWFGKWKLTAQAFFVAVPLGVEAHAPDALFMPFLYWLREPHIYAGIFWAMMLLTAYSGINYIVRAARVLGDNDG